MDEQLRANPHDVSALLRAGRLSVERVALAAYLGDERALATGVAPWVPPEDDGWDSDALTLDPAVVLPYGPLSRVLRWGSFTDRERVWLAHLPVARAVQLRTQVGQELAEVLDAVRSWCRGLGTREAVSAHHPGSRYLGKPAPNRRVYWALNSLFGFLVPAVLLSFDQDRDAAGRGGAFERSYACPGAALLAFSRHDRPGEQAWQAQAIAHCLLAPDWPPWEE